MGMKSVSKPQAVRELTEQEKQEERLRKIESAVWDQIQYVADQGTKYREPGKPFSLFVVREGQYGKGFPLCGIYQQKLEDNGYVELSFRMPDELHKVGVWPNHTSALTYAASLKEPKTCIVWEFKLHPTYRINTSERHVLWPKGEDK